MKCASLRKSHAYFRRNEESQWFDRIIQLRLEDLLFNIVAADLNHPGQRWNAAHDSANTAGGLIYSTVSADR